jgi:hypothetical protein
MKNIEHACFTVLDASINNAFKVSNNPAIIGWHAGMMVREILDRLSTTYGQPTPAAMELNEHSAANILQPMPPKSSSIALKIAQKLQFWVKIPTRIAS